MPPLPLAPLIHLDACALAFSHDDGDPVSNWSGAIQSARTSRPIFHTNVINGQPAVRFDGVDDFLILPVSAKTLTLFAVVRCATLITGNANASLLSFGNGVSLFYDQREDTQRLWTYRDATGNPQSAPSSTLTENALLCWQVSKAGFNRAWYNGAEAWNVAVGATDDVWPPSELVLAARNPAAPYEFAAFDFAELLIYPRDLNAADRAIVTACLDEKYTL